MTPSLIHVSDDQLRVIAWLSGFSKRSYVLNNIDPLAVVLHEGNRCNDAGEAASNASVLADPQYAFAGEAGIISGGALENQGGHVSDD